MIKRLTSRKFWSLVAVLVSSMLVLFDADAQVISEVTALISATGATITYLLIQGKLDDKEDK